MFKSPLDLSLASTQTPTGLWETRGTNSVTLAKPEVALALLCINDQKKMKFVHISVARDPPPPRRISVYMYLCRYTKYIQDMSPETRQNLMVPPT